MSDDHHDRLGQELLDLGRTIVIQPPRDDLAALVLARIDGEKTAPASGTAPGSNPTGSQGRWFAGRRLGWAIAAATVLVLALIPPVRAAMFELLRVGGVVVRQEPAPSTLPTLSPTVPPTGAGPTSGVGSLTLQRARAMVDFAIGEPAALGTPSRVAVTRDGRVVELTWNRGGEVTRLEVFEGALSWGYLKRVWQAVTPTQVTGHEAVWLDSPHLIEWVDRDGKTHSDPPRLAGPTLVWVVPGVTGDVTYRLEGAGTLAAATAIAESVH